MDRGDGYLAYGRSGQAPQEMECLNEILNKREVYGPIIGVVPKGFSKSREGHTQSSRRGPAQLGEELQAAVSGHWAHTEVAEAADKASRALVHTV